MTLLQTGNTPAQTPSEAGVENTEIKTAEQQTDLGGGENKPEQNPEGGEGPKKPEGEEEKTDKKDDKKDDKKSGEEENDLFGKPENYDYKDVKLPENMQLEASMTEKFSTYASQLNLSQKGANDLMAMAVELTEQTQQQTVEAMGKLTEAKIEGYRQLLNSDSEIGGAKLKGSLAEATLAYDGFFQDEDLRNLIAEGGLNLHPKFIKALKAIGSQMKQDTIHSSNNAAGDKKNREDILYSSMDEKQ